MQSRMLPAKRRRWADIVVIVASITVFLLAVWPSPELLSDGETGDVRSVGWLLAARAGGGALGIAAIVLAFKSTIAARLLTGTAGLLVLSGLAALRDWSGLSLLLLGVPGLMLLGAAPFMGPMPSPQEEEREEEREERAARG